jgi:hypothetical protein
MAGSSRVIEDHTVNGGDNFYKHGRKPSSLYGGMAGGIEVIAGYTWARPARMIERRGIRCWPALNLLAHTWQFGIFTPVVADLLCKITYS